MASESEGAMSKNKYSFSIVDFLVGLAILLILAGLFAPHFIDSHARSMQGTRPAATQPAR
jgi:Tfp pilus assembly protein FimT